MKNSAIVHSNFVPAGATRGTRRYTRRLNLADSIKQTVGL